MPLCVLCHQNLNDTSKIEAANDNVGILYVKNNRELLRPENITKIAVSLAVLPVSSREIINWIADTLFIRFEGIILWPDGEQFEIGDDDLDRIFDTPTVARWLCSIRQFADKPAKQTAPLALAERYRLLDIALQAENFVATKFKK